MLEYHGLTESEKQHVLLQCESHIETHTNLLQI